MAAWETRDYLSKYNNQLTALPDDIRELKKLKVLLVAGNPVTLEEMVKVVKIQKTSSHTYETGSVFLLGFPRPHMKTLMHAKRIEI